MRDDLSAGDDSNSGNAVRILVFTHASGAPKVGPNTRWYYLGRVLKEYDIHVELVGASFFHKYIRPPYVDSAISSEQIDGLQYHWIRTKPYVSRGLSQVRNQWSYVIGCFRAARMLARRNPDVIVASSPHPFCIFPATLIARRCNAALVFDVRDLWPLALRELGGFSRWHPYMIALSVAEWFAVRASDRIVSVKPGDCEYFERAYGVARDQVLYVPNGYLPQADETRQLPAGFSVLRSRYSVLVGYVGALSRYYGLERLVELARHFTDRDDVGFVVVGKGDCQARLEQMAADRAVENLHFVGQVAKDAVLPLMRAIDIAYVGLEDLSIHRYGISCNKIFEYMAAGKPILGSYSTRYDPVDAAGCGIVVDPSDPDRLARSLARLIDDEELRADCGIRAYEYFMRNHDYRSVGPSVAGEFRRLTRR